MKGQSQRAVEFNCVDACIKYGGGGGKGREVCVHGLVLLLKDRALV